MAFPCLVSDSASCDAHTEDNGREQIRKVCAKPERFFTSGTAKSRIYTTTSIRFVRGEECTWNHETLGENDE
jgi:hypothetical protein